ncbi:MAG: acyltransferase [Muribaculaceae bacterium]|nr:acyltransferase [Muribaculaceae bacterium]
MPNQTKPRQYGLDFLKGIAACFVVFMHVKFPDQFGDYVARVGTFAVPVFFMTSGYFALNASRSKVLRSLKRTAVYLLVAYLLNIVRIMVTMGFDMGSVFRFFTTEVLAPQHLLKVLVFSQSKLSGVAWFLISLMMCYALKYLLGKKLRYLGYAGAVIGIIGVLPPVSNHVGLPINNPWINGIPFFIIGELLHDHKAWVQEHIPNWLMIVSSIAGLAISIAACYYGTQWWYCGTLLLSPALFILSSRSDMKYNPICLMGSTYAFFIYIIHPLMMHAYDAIRTAPSTTELWLRPLIVLALTILLAIIYYSAKRFFIPIKAIQKEK